MSQRFITSVRPKSKAISLFGINIPVSDRKPRKDFIKLTYIYKGTKFNHESKLTSDNFNPFIEEFTDSSNKSESSSTLDIINDMNAIIDPVSEIPK